MAPGLLEGQVWPYRVFPGLAPQENGLLGLETPRTWVPMCGEVSPSAEARAGGTERNYY